MSKPKSKNPPSLETLSKALGVTVRRVSQLKRAGMPCETIEAAVGWKQAQSGSADFSVENLRKERLLLVRSQRAKIDLENDVRRGQLIEIDSVRADTIGVVSAARNSFLRLTNDLPPRLTGLDEIGICQVLRDEFHEVLVQLSGGKWTPREEIKIVLDSFLATPPTPSPKALSKLVAVQAAFSAEEATPDTES